MIKIRIYTEMEIHRRAFFQSFSVLQHQGQQGQVVQHGGGLESAAALLAEVQQHLGCKRQIAE